MMVLCEENDTEETPEMIQIKKRLQLVIISLIIPLVSCRPLEDIKMGKNVLINII